MNTNCPDCGKLFNEPQPDDYICPECMLAAILDTLSKEGIGCTVIRPNGDISVSKPQAKADLVN